MMQQSVWSSYIAASLAPHFLKENGLLVLTGAQPALNPTPGMIGYGVAKVRYYLLAFKEVTQIVVTVFIPYRPQFIT